MKEPIWRAARVIAALFFLGIAMAIYYQFVAGGTGKPDDMPAHLDALISALNLGLAINLASLLGVGSIFERQEKSKRLPRDSARLFLARFYGAMLCLTTVCWVIAEVPRSSGSVVAALSETSSNGIKISVAVLFATLGVEGYQRRREEARAKKQAPCPRPKATP